MSRVRVQISYLKREPYLQQADLSVAARLAYVVEETDETWVLEDDHGERHTVSRAAMEELGVAPDEGRWVVRQPIPSYAVGEKLRLGWRMRNCGYPSQRREDFVATIVAENAESVIVRGPEGGEHELLRGNGHEQTRAIDGKRVLVGRKEPRWVIIGRA